MYIPIKTLWERGDSLPENAEIDLKKKGIARLTFGGRWLPMWALKPFFGADDKLQLGNSFNAAGYDMTALEAEYNSDNSISVYIEVNDVPDDGPMTTALPIIAIVVGAGALLGGILLVMMLSKVEAILNLPVTWIVAGIVFLTMVPVSIAGLKKGAG